MNRRLTPGMVAAIVVAMVVFMVVLVHSCERADAAQSPCFHKAQYHGLKRGLNQAQVEARVGVASVRESGGHGPYLYFKVYPLCEREGSVTIAYGNVDHVWRYEILAVVL